MFRYLDHITVDAIEVLIKYCINSFPQVDQFIRIQISFYFLCVSYWSVGSEIDQQEVDQFSIK
jgi:hypothetical protein